MTDIAVAPPQGDAEPTESSAPRPVADPEQQSRRRFTTAVILGAAAVTLPYLWVLWDLWTGKINVLRSVAPDNFYELQARAMFDGRLDVPRGSLGIEGFLHGGRTYTYFGIWPSIIRMPILPFSHHWDGALTAPSLLIAWVLTGVFAGLLLWRIRFMMRGNALVGRAEAASYGALMATILGGSVVLYIAANPSTYDEDFAWSIALVLGSLFTLLGLLERPTTKGVVASGLLILAASLNRTPTGYACTITAFLIAGWFAMGKGGHDNRRWAPWIGLAGLLPLLANCAVTYGKFGMPFGLPMAEQVWAHTNAHRRDFLAANGGKAFSFGFIPSTAWAYLNPTALRFTSVFPFLAAPATPAHAITAVTLDQTYATSSVTAASPLLFLAALWGTITAFKPRGQGQIRHVRLVLVGAAIATGGVLVWGYISYRYVSDLIPFLVVGSAIGLVDVWRRLEGTSTRVRGWVMAVICALAAFGVAANTAITASPSTWFSSTQVHGFVSQQDSTTPGALARTVTRRSSLPYYAPAGSLIIVNSCDGLYRSTGDTYKDSPGQQIEHSTWVPVEQAGFMTHTIDMQFNTDHWTGPAVPLLTYGNATLLLEPAPNNQALIRVVNAGAPALRWPSSVGFAFPQVLHGVYQITVTTDPNLHSIVVGWYKSTMINRYLAGTGPAQVAVTPVPGVGTSLPSITVTEVPMPPTHMPLCRSLLNASTPTTVGQRG